MMRAMTVALTLLARDDAARRVLEVDPGTTILGAAHAHGIDIDAVCGGRGRCTSCRVKFVGGRRRRSAIACSSATISCAMAIASRARRR